MTQQAVNVGGTEGVRVLVERMAQAAEDFLAALSTDQRRQAAFDFPDEEERRQFFYTPTDHGGLPLRGMDPAQQRKAHRFVATGLSLPGYVTASTVMGLENTLDAIEGWDRDFFRDTGPGARGRDPQLYYISVFGTPGGRAPWGWRFGGHHISLSYTIVDGRIVSPTPSFFGSNPADAPLLGGHELRPLAGLEDLGRELLHTLDAEQRTAAVLSPVAPPDLVVANRPHVEDGLEPPARWDIFRETRTDRQLEQSAGAQVRMAPRTPLQPEQLEAVRYVHTPKGLAAAKMTPGQRDLLRSLLRQYIDRMPDELAAVEAAKLAGAALEAIHFAWAGGDQRKQGHYYRIHGPRLLVEYDNTQDGANHIHSVWRDPEGDFGADLLAQHYAQAH